MNKNKTNKVLILFGLLLIIITLIVINSKKSNNYKNVLVFKNSDDAVVDSLRVMRDFIYNLSLHADRKLGYYIDKSKSYNYMYIEGKRILNINEIKNNLIKSKQTSDSFEINIINTKVLNILPNKTISRFMHLVIFLDSNYISSSYIDKYYNQLIFTYRDTLIYDDKDVRNIVLLESLRDSSQFLKEVKVYDRKDGLILFSPYK